MILKKVWVILFQQKKQQKILNFGKTQLGLFVKKRHETTSISNKVHTRLKVSINV